MVHTKLTVKSPQKHSQQVRETYCNCFIKEHGKYYTFNHLLKLKWITVLYEIDRFLFWVCGYSYSKIMTLFPESCMKKGKWWSVVSNYKQLYKNPCVTSTQLKQIVNGSLCYSETIYIHFSPNKSILKELWMFFACVYIEKLCLQLWWLGKSSVIGFSHLQCYCNAA